MGGNRLVRGLLSFACAILAAPLCVVVAFWVRVAMPKRAKPRLVWGPAPIISNRYWSQAMRQVGFESVTLMSGFYASINKRSDYDLYFEDLLSWLPGFLRLGATKLWGGYAAFVHALLRYDVFHHPYNGGFLGATPCWRFEAAWLRLAGKKTVVIPYGSDAYRYSTVLDPCLRHGLLMSYPEAGKEEATIQKKVAHWARRADVVATGLMIDGMGRWDILAYNQTVIDVDQWTPRDHYSATDGLNGTVVVVHTPNHRGVKGTEFLVAAVEMLRQEGLKIELRLLEKLQNDEVRRILQQDADILAEQFILGYALSAIEGMACGLPVLSNLDFDSYTRVFRRYSYLDECPILSTSPETLTHNLRLLVTRPDLRLQLGKAGRQYVEKYHSPATAQYLFGAVYDRVWFGKDVDLMRLFHPLVSSYRRARPVIEHPLVEGHLPAGIADQGAERIEGGLRA